MNLRNWLVENGINQAEFADRLGISRPWLSCIVSGKKIPGKRLADSIEMETDGKIKAAKILDGSAVGYVGRERRVHPNSEKKQLPKNRLSLI